MELETMAKPKKKAALKTDRPEIRPTALTIKGWPEWREWLEEGAKYCRTDVSKLMDTAVTKYLKETGFPKPPPER